jgi:hypothetical protein
MKLRQTRQTLETVLSRVIPVTESGCWLWEGHQNGRYGTCGANRKNYVVHRYVYVTAHIGDEADNWCRNARQALALAEGGAST